MVPGPVARPSQAQPGEPWSPNRLQVFGLRWEAGVWRHPQIYVCETRPKQKSPWSRQESNPEPSQPVQPLCPFWVRGGTTNFIMVENICGNSNLQSSFLNTWNHLIFQYFSMRPQNLNTWTRKKALTWSYVIQSCDPITWSHHVIRSREGVCQQLQTRKSHYFRYSWDQFKREQWGVKLEPAVSVGKNPNPPKIKHKRQLPLAADANRQLTVSIGC